MSAINGLELSRRFYSEEVAPRIAQRWPDLAYSAALIGHGSEVLGFDDDTSPDHHWGPRVMLFLRPDDLDKVSGNISSHLAQTLPYEFLGFPTNFSAPNPEDPGVQLLSPINEGPVNHRVEMLDLGSYLGRYLGVEDPSGIDEHDWLTLPEQKLRSLTSGDVFHDGLPVAALGGAAAERDAPSGGTPAPADGRAAAPANGTPTTPAAAPAGALTRMRELLAYYPRNVWYYQIASCWARIGQEEHLMGRAGSVGDEVGSAVIGARLVRDVMRLCFLMERTYAPYAKWFGTAFRQLSCGPELYAVLQAALTAVTWKEREVSLVTAYERIARMHNELGFSDPLPENAHQFHGRRFSVIADHGFAEAVLEQIEPEFLTDVTRRSPIGGIDLFSDNTDLLEDSAFRSVLRALYDRQA